MRDVHSCVPDIGNIPCNFTGLHHITPCGVLQYSYWIVRKDRFIYIYVNSRGSRYFSFTTICKGVEDASRRVLRYCWELFDDNVYEYEENIVGWWWKCYNATLGNLWIDNKQNGPQHGCLLFRELLHTKMNDALSWKLQQGSSIRWYPATSLRITFYIWKIKEISVQMVLIQF